MDKLEKRFESLESNILDPKCVFHVDALLVRSGYCTTSHYSSTISLYIMCVLLHLSDSDSYKHSLYMYLYIVSHMVQRKATTQVDARPR